MEAWNKNIILKEFRESEILVYLPETGCGYDENKKNILMISHTLERGGAPLVLLELMKQYQEQYNVFLLSKEDGNLRGGMLENNIPTAICTPLELRRVSLDMLTKSFEMIWVNTLVCYEYLLLFQNTDEPVYWWIHEPEVLFKNYYQIMPNFSMYSSNIKILPVSKLVQNYIRKYYNMETDILHMPIDDVYIPTDEKRKEDSLVTFFMPAKFQYVKGQDILATVILDMPEEYRQRAQFIFAGAEDTNEPDYYKLISTLEKAFPLNVKMLGEISKQDVYDIYAKVDCVIAPSRFDATPTTIVEGMMFNNLCICSDHTGISLYMDDKINGFIVKNEDANDLMETIKYVIDHISEMGIIREAGRKIYLDNFETNVVWKKIRKITEK